MENNNTSQNKRALFDIVLICTVTMIVLGIIMAFQESIYGFARDKEINILLRTVVMALCQFSVAGLGITIVILIRKEKLKSYGLHGKNVLKSIILCVLSFLPNIIFNFATGKIDSYLPFQSVWMTKEILDSNFFIGVIGYLIIALTWGFFEGFNYVVICDKINQLLPVKNKWLNWGAIICGAMCILIHGMIGVTPENIIEMLTAIIAIYGMLVARNITGNAWGCVFVFVFIWNAI